METSLLIWIYTEPKKKRQIHFPQNCNSKTIPYNNNMHFITWQTSCSHLLKDMFLFHHSWQKYQTVTENVTNSEKHACATTFSFFQNLPIFINQKKYVQECPSIHSFKNLKVKHFKILKLSPLQLNV